MSCALVTRIAFGKCPLKLEAKTALPIRGCPNVMRVTSFNPKLTYKNIELVIKGLKNEMKERENNDLTQ